MTGYVDCSSEVSRFSETSQPCFFARWRIVQAGSIVHQSVAETDLASENAQPKYPLGRAQ